LEDLEERLQRERAEYFESTGAVLWVVCGVCTKLPHQLVQSPVSRGPARTWRSYPETLRTDSRPGRGSQRIRDSPSSLMPRPISCPRQNTARFAARELLAMSTTGPSPASAAGHFSDEVCRTTLQPSTSAGAGVTATLTSRPGAIVSTADI